MKRRAFTLIELLVVISIIALLLSILMPGLQKAKAQARRLICGTRMKSLHYAAFLYANDDSKGRLPQGGMHTNVIDYDDGIGLETANYFKLSNYITSVPGLPTDPDVINAMSLVELRPLAKACAEEGAGEIFLCPSVQKGDKGEYMDQVFNDKRRMKTVIFSNKNYVRIGYCYLAGFETGKWDFNQQGGISRGTAARWNSPSTTSDSGTWTLATDRTRYVPAGAGWVNEDLMVTPHSGNGYKNTSPVGADFDYTTADGGNNVLTLDGAVEHKKFPNTKARQMFNDGTGGGINHEDYTFF